MTAPDSHPLLRLLPLTLVVTGAILGVWLLGDRLTFESIRENREALIALRDADYLRAALLFVTIYIVIVSFSLPGATISTLVGGFLFGTGVGTVLNMIAATIGATILFLAARTSLGARLAARMDESSGKVKALKEGIDRNQWSMLFIMRFAPVVPFFVGNLIPAFVGVPLHRFVISTALGIIPGALVYTSAGAGLGAVFDSGDSFNFGLIFEPQFLWPLIGLCALSLLPMLMKLKRKPHAGHQY